VRFAEGGRLQTQLLDFQASDIYSLGICVWELLHRERPWNGFKAEVPCSFLFFSFLFFSDFPPVLALTFRKSKSG